MRGVAWMSSRRLMQVPERSPVTCGWCGVRKSGPFHWVKFTTGKASWVCTTCRERLSDDE